MDNEQLRFIHDEVACFGPELSEDQCAKLCRYYEMLVEKNKVMNLTRIVDFEDAVRKHFADSLAITNYIDLSGEKQILDLGTGAGFPGIPLKIAFPNLKVIMIDSVGKKVNFVNEVIRELGLADEPEVLPKKIGTAAIHARAEELASDSIYRERFDLCVSRAVANLSTLSEYCLPFVRKGGLFVSYKSGESNEEIKAAGKAISILGGSPCECFDYELRGMGRTLVKVVKIRKTPSIYPRKAGTPSKQPLS